VTKRAVTDFDAIVIGAGHNGLITAAYLAQHGLSTLLIESRSEVGGTSASEQYGGATVDNCNYDHLTFRSTPIAEELNLSAHGLTYIDVEPPQINGDWTTEKFWPVWHDVERTLDELSTAHPTSVNGYKQFAETAIPVARLFLEAATNPPSRGSLLSTAVRRGGRGVVSLIRMSRMSAADVMRQFFDDEAVIGPAMVEGPVMLGLSPETPGTGLGAISYALRHVGTSGRPVGGSGMLTESLKQSFLAAGGYLRTSTRVVGVICEGSRVSAVQTGDGATVTSRIVVSACDPQRTFVQWLKNPPAKASSLVSRWKTHTTVEGYKSKIDAITNTPPLLNAFTDSLTNLHNTGSTVIVSPSLAELHRGSQLMRDGKTMPRMALLANTPSNIDSTIAPAGKSVLGLEVLYTPYSFVDGWESREEPERWLRQFGSLVQPDFMESIDQWRVVTPAGYETQFHVPKGHALSFGGGPLAAFMSTTPELTRYHTPIKGLYLTGTATFPGAGVWGSSGRNAALTIIKEMG
jgi:phytoene dehydrogenase-like protein